ncbi:carbohydrate ABC transporter membrane protein 2 (CUT1 family) [Kribbella voronezhensis]|uniref:Carbohydrate ABC transporter membrane protein 2 (CUT1 family) n=1 Tax=Kribbella voronezhensis TaxID=2512212 RepID=A0A4R7T9Q7_9ACTN|nr:carbohydrate ABC transporter permease [Kribbella voronezhensis]TDU87968.1 carbohydrate ABC transporter membrane protein 2 (CUT1 family) [Kribbella voronezhensis]
MHVRRPAPTGVHRVSSRKPRLSAGAVYVLLMALAVLFVGPFVWLLLAALKTRDEWAAVPTHILPRQAQWENFTHALTDINFPAYAVNSLFLSTMYAVLVTASSAVVGFGFARLRGSGKRGLFLVLLSTMMLPQILTLLPTYVLFSRLGLVNTYWPWVLWGVASSPYLIFLFRQFFAAIPSELEDAAIIDGCGWGRIFVRIFLPLSRPVLLTSFLLSFVWTWGDYIAPALLLDVDHTTLSVAITAWYRDPHGNAIPTVQAAAAALYVLPALLIFLFAQRYFIRSIVSSGVKG